VKTGHVSVQFNRTNFILVVIIPLPRNNHETEYLTVHYNVIIQQKCDIDIVYTELGHHFYEMSLISVFR